VGTHFVMLRKCRRHVVACAPDRSPNSESNLPEHEMQRIALNATATYTMQSEREVHESLYDSAPRNQDFPPGSASTATEEDNVEFF
jgi:hypothetical protein